ncbi:MAG: T9SS type A sorting domain-containing protein [Bacteroidales bacterium]|nr:T9SS type A sorting domain-containing protein [Bacteroidales bacterium]
MRKLLFLIILLFILPYITLSQNTSSDSMDIIHYNINLDIVHLSNKKLSGYAELTFLTHPQQQNLYFDLLELQVDSVIIEGQNKPFQYNDTLLSVIADSTLTLTDTLTAIIYYQGQPVVEAANWGGFHFLSDSSLAYNLGIAFQAKPHNYGKVWFPCADNFIDRATYEFHIRTNSDNMAICTGTRDSVTTHANNEKIWHWRMNKTIPTYLASVAVSNFSVIEGQYSGLQSTIPTYLHVSPSDSIDALNSFVNLNDILSSYEQSYGPYRWPRVGYVGTVKGAMEHATSIAYPRHCIDGTLNCESLLAHELSHSWFGNLVTCESAEDMWMNEGWAVFSEATYKEGLYGKAAYKDYMRSKLHEVIQTAHITDNGYRALYGIPHEYTYGATVYDKGATVVHSLRNYLGDSLFFPTVKAYLDSFAFDHASTDDLNQFINTYSGVNVDEFFNAWIYRPGFSHFSVDSFRYIEGLAQFNTEIYIRQRLLGTSQYANRNKLQLGVLMENQDIIYKTITFSGADTVVLYNFPDEPVDVMMDPNEYISDATTDHSKTIKSTGNYSFPDTYAEINVQSIQDSSFLRITHNWVAPPDSQDIQPPLYHLSKKRYWQVEGVIPQGFHAKVAFEYRKFGNLDEDLIQSVTDSLTILFRKNRQESWRPVPASQTGSTYAGEIIIDTLRRGYYVLAKYDKSLSIINSADQKEKFKINPNPAKNSITISKQYSDDIRLHLYNSNGKLLYATQMGKYEKEKKIQLPELSSGVYFIQFINNKNGFERTKKLVIQL